MGLIKVEYPVEGMTCAACATSVESMLAQQTGIHSATVNFANQSVWVEMDDTIHPKSLDEALRKIGYSLILKKESQEEEEHRHSTKMNSLVRQLLISAPLALVVMVLSMFVGEFPGKNYLLMALTLVVLIVGGNSFFIGAIKQLRNFTFNMDSLVAMGTGTAFLFSSFNTIFPDFLLIRGVQPNIFFESSAVIIGMILFGRFLEDRAKRNASGAIRKLMDLQPDRAIILYDGKETEVSLSQITPGNILRVRPGARIPVDGLVQSGTSYVNESMISGEPIPSKKAKGDHLIAGTINGEGSLEMIAEAVGNDTMLARIIQLVKEAQGSKAPVQKLADKISSIFVPVVIVLAFIAAIVWYFAGPEPVLANSLVVAVAVMVIACPCALGLATPTAIMVGIGRGAQEGILIKDALSLELIRETEVLVVDKTGTITTGQPEVKTELWTDNHSKSEFGKLLSEIEKRSGHPLGNAICNHLNIKSDTIKIQDFGVMPGKGVWAQWNDRFFYAGNEKWMNDAGIKTTDDEIEGLSSLKQAGESLVFFGEGGKLLAVFGISDPLRPETIGTIQNIHHMGIEVVMMTGDNDATAKAVANEAGIKVVRANCLPGDKAEYVKTLMAEGKKVTMVGDGINDSPALAEANVGIAMGSGTDIAMESAGMVLVGGGIRKLIKAIRLSKATVQTLRLNLFWAFIYNVIGIPVAAGVLYPFFGYKMDPMLAGAAMALSSVSVVTNSLLLRYRKL